MAHIMSAQHMILIVDSWNIMMEGERDILSRRLPVKLVYTEEYNYAAEAFEREKQVQNWSRAKREALINGNRASLPGLAKKIFEKKK